MNFETLLRAIGLLENNFNALSEEVSKKVLEYGKTSIAVSNHYIGALIAIGIFFAIVALVFRLCFRDLPKVSLVIALCGLAILIPSTIMSFQNAYLSEMWKLTPDVMVYKTVLGMLG